MQPFVRKIKYQCQGFNPLIYFDSKLFIEKLMKMKKELKKKHVIRQKKTRNSKTITFLIVIF